ncbi:NUDIX hydrolase domain-like protein [Chlamydoabsidia padenii]|nr:NUDIX hydrolase domain-like protein [Chlamydoabsidia padenii]
MENQQPTGCLPIDPIKQRILLISSSNKNNDHWVLPKGGWEVNETQAQAALRETWEKAGIKGKITRTLGIFEEASKKQVKAHHWIFEMEIQEICKKFPEKKKRERRWYTYEEALVVMKGQYLKDALMLSSLNPANRSNPHVFPPVTTLISPPSINLPHTVPKQSSPSPPPESKHSLIQGLKTVFKKT